LIASSPRPIVSNALHELRVVVNGFEDLAEPRESLLGVAPEERELRVTCAYLQVQALFRLDALGKVFRQAAQPAGQQPDDGGSRGSLPRLDQ
jgi:hypothetical protein